MAKKPDRPLVVRKGAEIVVPEKMKLPEVVQILNEQIQFEEQIVQISHHFEMTPWADAALALHKAMMEVFLWVNAKEEVSFFGTTPPRMVQVKTDAKGGMVNVPIGEFGVASAENAKCKIIIHRGECHFAIQTKRKYEDQFNRVIQRALVLIKEESLYRGKSLTFRRDEDDENDIVDFMSLHHADSLILPAEVERDMKANIWTLLQKPGECKRLGIPSKRAILMHGNYGVGKTLAAQRTAYEALDAKNTFVYVTDARDLSEAHRFAVQLAPSVLFVEDVDRYVDDSDYVATLANVLDGINTKGTGVMLIATTNHVEKIPAILLRPGRIDASIEVLAPDPDTVKRLVMYYAPTLEGDVTEAAKELSGNIPAVIREACERSKLFALSAGRSNLVAQDLLDAARSLRRQTQMLEIATQKKFRVPTPGENLHRALHDVVHKEPENKSIN